MASQFIIPTTTNISYVQCKNAFNALNLKEKLYAYYFTRASWAGARACYFQRSYESPALFYLFQRIFLTESPSVLRSRLVSNSLASEDELNQLIVYTAAVFANCGNYKSYGDSKFIPELPKDRFHSIIQSTAAYAQEKANFDEIWEGIHHEIYEFNHPYQVIDFTNNKGLSSYYSSNITQHDAERINQFMEQQSVNLSPLNTRLIKHSETNYQILVASEDTKIEENFTFEDLSITVTYGDMSPFMRDVRSELEKAIPFAENEHQAAMLKSYCLHFSNGSIEEHKNSQRHWIKDKGPIIETNIGFIESYLDPLKVRAEFEGFVSIVNKEESRLLENLVQNAEEIIKNLPWPKEFEVEKFTKPDFTSLEVLSFASSGTPLGINIPNYDDIRQSEGFKNVNLGNVYGQPTRETVLFADEASLDLYVKHFKDSLFVIVALHELLGHGTGKLFQKSSSGELNFELGKVIHPILNEPVNTFYESTETWHSKFGDVSSGYEECRADTVALYLATFQEPLDILLPHLSKEDQSDVVYAAWYEIVVSTVRGLEFYNPELKKWGQAHTVAAYVIVRVLQEAGEGLVQFEKTVLNGKPSVEVHLDKSKIWTVGKQALHKFLIGLQVYKSTGDSERGTAFFNRYAEVDEQMLELREIALANKKPRKLELQMDLNLVGDNENVEIQEFEKTHDGIINSFTNHYRGNIDDVLLEWRKHAKHFRFYQQ